MESNQMMSISAKWQPKKLDLGLAAIIAILFPVLAGLLYGTTGALLPMLLYYALAWILIKWRRGSTGYFNPLPKKITGFFYLNVGMEHEGYLARVEIPAWVAEEPSKLDMLHAVLISQCRMLGPRPYPYLLHRAHETAVVSFDEKEQVTQMVVNELLMRGVSVPRRSNKQAAKDVGRRTRYGK
mgnify:CR=1 FL=1